eukprot:1034481-Pelagomonas_calceolata.AAC.1
MRARLMTWTSSNWAPRHNFLECQLLRTSKACVYEKKKYSPNCACKQGARKPCSTIVIASWAARTS